MIWWKNHYAFWQWWINANELVQEESPSPRWKPLKNPASFVSRDFGREKGISSRRSYSLTHSRVTLPFILQMFWSSNSLIFLVNRWRLRNFFSFHLSYSKFQNSKLLFTIPITQYSSTLVPAHFSDQISRFTLDSLLTFCLKEFLYTALNSFLG